MFNEVTEVIRQNVTNGQPNVAQQAFMQWLLHEEEDRQSNYKAYREYYEGIHKTQLTKRMRAYLSVATGATFDANYCPIVVDAMAERLKVVGFEAEGQGGDDGPLWLWWQQNRMDGLQSDVHTAAIRDGDTYVIAEWDNERGIPAFSHEMAYDGQEGVRVHYRKEKRSQIAFASKRWRVESSASDAGQKKRLNVYTADAIYKYHSLGAEDSKLGGWIPLQEEGEPWPIPWVAKDGRPLGVPVFHFRNKAKGYNYGLSELESVLPLQNALNKSIIDLLAAADSTGFRIYTMLGGDPSGLTVAPGSWVYMEQPPGEGQIGHIPGEDLKPLIEVVDSFITRVAQVTRTPLTYFQASRQLATAETQGANESGLVSKVEDRAVPFANSWEDVMYMGRRLHNTFGDSGLAGDVIIETQWDSFERVDRGDIDRKSAETADLKSQSFERLVLVGVDRYTAALLAGYSEEEAQDIAQTGGRVLPEDEENGTGQPETT
jgi:hypothetical protein